MQSRHVFGTVTSCLYCLLSVGIVTSTPFNPHVPDQTKPWFEGWYTRITTESTLSFAAVTGSFPNQDLTYPAAFAGVLCQLQTGATQAYQAFPSDLRVTGPDGQPIHQQPDQLSKANFALQATDQSFNFSIDGLSFNMSAVVGTALLTAQGTGVPMTWGPKPGDSPEGSAAKLPLLNLDWYVYSLAYPVNWTFHDPHDPHLGPEVLSGQGWAHMEKNWGRAFPNKWVWAQGLLPDKQRASHDLPEAVFALAGGPVPIATPWLSKLPSLLPQAWLLGFYSRKLGHWNFHPADPTLFKVASDACAGSFEIQATSLRRSLVIKLQAPTNSFVGLQCPTAAGFRIESVESFLGHAHIEAFVYQLWPWRDIGWKLVEAVDIHNVALEFGGLYRCQQDIMQQDAAYTHAEDACKI